MIRASHVETTYLPTLYAIRLVVRVDAGPRFVVDVASLDLHAAQRRRRFNLSLGSLALLVEMLNDEYAPAIAIWRELSIDERERALTIAELPLLY